MSNIVTNVDQDRLDDLLDQWEEYGEEGRDVSIKELCKDFPELELPLREQIRLLHATSWLDAEEAAEGTDVWTESQIPRMSQRDGDTKLPQSSLTLEQFSQRITHSGVLEESELLRFQQGRRDNSVENGERQH